MSALFSTPDIPSPAPPPTPPPIEDEDARLEEVKEEERQRQKAKKGRASTILTGPQGLAGPATVQRKTLLGQ
jgi:hypothetical protein